MEYYIFSTLYFGLPMDYATFLHLKFSPYHPGTKLEKCDTNFSQSSNKK